MRFLGKTVLVTGGSTGIGKAVAVRFAREGASVAVNYYKHKEEGEDTVEQCRAALRESGVEGATVMLIQADVSVEDEVERMFTDVIDRFGRLDILINNSGIVAEAASDELSMKSYDRVVGVNLRGAFLCAGQALRHFLSRPGGGVILNNSSVHEIIPKPQYVSYSISKGGMENMTKTLALEYADRGIRVNAVGPGAILTPMNDSWAHDDEMRAEVESHIPMGRAGQPEEIASVFAFLASEDASYITGQTIFACGGVTLYPEFRGTWAS